MSYINPVATRNLEWSFLRAHIFAECFGAAIVANDLVVFDMTESQGGSLTVFDSAHPFNFVRPHNVAVATQDLHIFGIALESAAVGDRCKVLMHGVAEVRTDGSVVSGQLCVPLADGSAPTIEPLAVTALAPALVVARAVDTDGGSPTTSTVMFNGLWGIGTTGVAY